MRYQNQNGDFDYSKFKEHVSKALPKYTESLATQLLGQPNQSKSDRDYLTFGIGKSAFKVTLTGEYRGYFKDYTTPRHIAKFEQRAKEYVQTSQPLEGTLAETYLKKLGIKNPQSEHVLFHQTVYSSEDKRFHPAMITNIHNKQGETKAIEVTYLDYQGNKGSTLDTNPRTLGTKSKK
ncbi:hypothetical protein THF1D04_400004 [Vibrio owensii]|uniref:DUF7146 domain-containing protein n=1 Tax=Vibrio owensii TaxID=696485 RepID=A0AAU9Q9T0_9VIBR|nr:hypothetical protein THF1D04_400004 [Vibrio owensii]